MKLLRNLMAFKTLLNKCNGNSTYIPYRWISSTNTYQKERKKYQTEEEINTLPEFVFVGEHHKTGCTTYIWGNALMGALGKRSLLRPDKKKRQKMYPYLRIPNRLKFGDYYKVMDIACGYGFTLFAVKNEGGHTCFGTGNNTDGQIGYHEVRRGHPLRIIIEPNPLRPPLKRDEHIVKVSGGRSHSLMVTNTNKLFSIGNNAYGQCGRPIIDKEDYLFSTNYHHIEELEGYQIEQIECGQDNSFALTSDGKVFSCGWSADGQTGRGHYNNESTMGEVLGDIMGEKIVKVSCRADCVLALNDKGDVFGWGNSEYRQLTSITDEKQLNVSKHIPLSAKYGKIKDIAASGSSCFIVSESGELYSWGYGHLGIGRDYLFSEQPNNIPLTLLGANVLTPNVKVDSVTCGINSVAVINSDQNLFMWGKNSSGCLGLGTEETQYYPLRVSLMGKILKVSCGVDHTAAILKRIV